MIARRQNLGHPPAAVKGRARVVGRIEETRVERVALDGIEVTHHSRQQPGHRIEHAQGGRLAS